MKLFKCKHKWEFYERSNALQLDDMGYPLRLFVVKCSECGKSKQEWIDVGIEELDLLETGDAVLVKWL